MPDIYITLLIWIYGVAENEYGKRSKILNNFLDFCSQTKCF